jgi:hypothetical protein
MTFPENFSHNTIFLGIGLFYGIREIFWQFLAKFLKNSLTSCNLFIQFLGSHKIAGDPDTSMTVPGVVTVMTFSSKHFDFYTVHILVKFSLF